MEYSTVSNVSHFFRTLFLGFFAIFARCSFDKKESKHAFHWKPLELYMTSHHTKIHRESIKNVKCQSFCSISRIILVQLLRLRENLNIFSLHRFKCLRAGLCFRGRAKVYQMSKRNPLVLVECEAYYYLILIVKCPIFK